MNNHHSFDFDVYVQQVDDAAIAFKAQLDAYAQEVSFQTKILEVNLEMYAQEVRQREQKITESIRFNAVQEKTQKSEPGEKKEMSYATTKQLDAIRGSVTGIGWADPKQAAIYTHLRHRDICEHIAAGDIPHSRLGARKVRIRYSDLDEFMLSNRFKTMALDDLVDEIIEPYL